MTIVETVANAVESSLRKRKKVIEILSQDGRFGWEKWLQVELAHELSQLGNPVFEVRYQYDNRRLKPLSKKDNKKFSVDLEFRKKTHLKNYTTAVELKLNGSQKGLRAALSDLIRIGALSDGEWKFRSVIAVLVYGIREKDTKFSKVMKSLVDRFGARQSTHYGYGCLVFGWESSNTKKMTRESYTNWLKSVSDLYEENGCSPRTARSRDGE